MLNVELNENEVRALRKLNREPVQSSTLQTTSTLMSPPMAEVRSSMPIPDTPKEGVVVKIAFAGACYTEGPQRRRRLTPRFPGNEIAGTIYSIGHDLPNCNYTVGDKVIVFPHEDMEDTGYAEYLAIEDTRNVLQIPDNMSLDVAAMLPGGALTAYAALLTAQPHVEKLQKVRSCVNVLVVGGGGLGLWTIRIAQLLMGEHCNNVRLFVADNSIDKLLTAQDHGCFDIIHWNEEDHEQYIVERTLDACRGGVDVIIDFVSSHRSMQRSLKVLNREGLILIGGNNTSETSIPLNVLAAKQQSIVGQAHGNLNQLMDLVSFVSEGKLRPPTFAVFPVEDANQVYDDIVECRITGRAVFKFCSSSSTLTTDNH